MLESIIFIVISIIALIVLKIILGINIKKIKELVQRTDLDELTKDLANAEEMTKDMLKKLNNTDVNVTKMLDEKTGTSLYLVMNNTISLGDMENKYARVQTIAHECLHSVQSKKMLWFNFIYSNLYILYFFISIALTIFGVFKNTTLQLFLIVLLGFIQYVVRAYLETDAMTKAPYLAKEYLEESKLSKEVVEKLMKSYEEINKQTIPMVNFQLFSQILGRGVIYSIIAIILMLI